MITIPCANITLDGIDISPIYPKKNKYHNSPYNAPLVNVLPTKKPGHIVPIGQPLPPEGPLQTFQSNANTGHIVKGTDGSILESSVVDRRNKNGKKYIQDSRIKFETEEKLFTANAYKAPDHVVTKGMDKKIIDKVLRSKLKSGETFWKPKSQLELLNSGVSIVLGDSKGRKDYFRAFANVMKAPPSKDRAAQLLPHKFRTTMRLYGVSPLILLKKTHVRPKPILKEKGREKDISSSRKRYSKPSNNNLKNTVRKESPLLVKNGPRAVGPEIAPNFGEENEFDFQESDFEKIGELKDLTLDDKPGPSPSKVELNALISSL